MMPIPCCPEHMAGKVPTFVTIPSGEGPGEVFCRKCMEGLIDWLIDDCQEAYGPFAVLDSVLPRARKIYERATERLGPGLCGYSVTDLLLDQIDYINTETAAALAGMLKEERR